VSNIPKVRVVAPADAYRALLHEPDAAMDLIVSNRATLGGPW